MAEKSKRNPNWSRDELILALDFYVKNRGKSFEDTSEEVQRLAREVNAVGRALGLTGSDTFRNAVGASMKLQNFRSRDPDVDAKGLSRGNRLEQVLMDEFVADPAKLASVADAIRAIVKLGEMPLASMAADEVDAQEGRVLTRLHTYRERDRKIVKRKKDSFRKKHGALFCEVCNFDFSSKYGERGANFIECHHTKPVSELMPGEKTKLADLALLCANCHRMIHAARPWWSIEELRASFVSN